TGIPMAEPQTKKATTRKGPAGEAAPTTPPKFRELIPGDLNIDFVGKRRFFVALSTVLNIVALILLFTVGLNYGVDFRGGTDVRVRFAEPTTAGDLRSELADLDLRELTVQDFGNQGREFLLRFDIEEGAEMSSIGERLSEAFRKSRPQEGAF